MPLPAGVGLPFPPFLAATLLGVVAWNLPLVGAGYLLQDSGFSTATITLVAFAFLIACEVLLGLWLVMGKKTPSGAMLHGSCRLTVGALCNYRDRYR
jgi:membrane protein DedA with SNARE-associated domain